MQPPIRCFDFQPSPDLSSVAGVARLLRIREFEVFEKAYRWWQDRDLDEDTLNKVFGNYLLHQTVPTWVRHYCRTVRRLAAAGELDPRQLGVIRPTVHYVTAAEQRQVGFAALMALLIYLLFLA